jgi:hypothetical protein
LELLLALDQTPGFGERKPLFDQNSVTACEPISHFTRIKITLPGNAEMHQSQGSTCASRRLKAARLLCQLCQKTRRNEKSGHKDRLLCT